MTIGLIITLFLVSLNKNISGVEQGLEVAGCTLRETREKLGAWPRAHPHSGSALEKIYIELTVNDLINTCTDPGHLLTLWVPAEVFNR